ncbi:MAG: hypothetical protein ACHQJ7_02925 [Vicinamibacteria bacterium]|jgi:predicted SnoaL-like aldol condensation-catalyzing enzyme
MSKLPFAVLVAAVLACAAPPAAHADTGDGAFESRGFRMPVASALAFRGRSTIDKADVIVVAISNGDFKADWFANFHDRRRAIQQRMKASDIAIVYLEFKPDGAYRGYSFYFGPGNGCGYCAGNLGVTSTVKLTQGKLVGTWKLKDDARTADVKLDVPILSDDHGAALPADGGEPGKAFLAYHDALVKRDAKAVRALVSNENGQWLDAAAKKGKVAAELASMAKDHPEKSVRIVQGWSKGNRAVLIVAGETSVVRLAGDAVLVNEGGRWRVDDELYDVVMQ